MIPICPLDQSVTSVYGICHNTRPRKAAGIGKVSKAQTEWELSHGVFLDSTKQRMLLIEKLDDLRASLSNSKLALAGGLEKVFLCHYRF